MEKELHAKVWQPGEAEKYRMDRIAEASHSFPVLISDRGTVYVLCSMFKISGTKGRVFDVRCLWIRLILLPFLTCID